MEAKTCMIAKGFCRDHAKNSSRSCDGQLQWRK
jgi:hypothetical protein